MQIQYLSPIAPVSIHQDLLPHWHQNDVVNFVTWRLADSLPLALLQAWQQERTDWVSENPEPRSQEQWQRYHQLFSTRISNWLDQGFGSQLLGTPMHAALVADVIRRFDGVRHHLHAFVIMPTHVHVVFTPHEGRQLDRIVQGWKSVSAHRLIREHGVAGPVWQRGYWDRLIRDVRHFERVCSYVLMNPRKAKLAEGRYLVHAAEHVRHLV